MPGPPLCTLPGAPFTQNTKDEHRASWRGNSDKKPGLRVPPAAQRVWLARHLSHGDPAVPRRLCRGMGCHPGRASCPRMNVPLVGSASGPARHGALFLLESEPRVRSSPHFHVFLPNRHKARSVLQSRRGCQGPVEGEGLEKSLYETSLLTEAKPRGPGG